MGKSTIFIHLIKKFLAQGWKVVLYDSEHEFYDLKHRWLRIIKPKHPPKSKEAVLEFDETCEKVLKEEQCILAVESIGAYADPFHQLAPNFWKIVHWGRKIQGDVTRGLGLIVTARRIKNMSKDIVALSDHAFIFRTQHKNDREPLIEDFSPYMEKSGELPQFSFIYWTHGILKVDNTENYR